MPIEDPRYTINSRFAVFLAPSAPTLTPDLYTSETHEIILTSALTINAPVNMVDGQMVRFRLIQDGTGSRLLTLNAIFNVPASITVTLSTGANKCDHLVAVYRQAVNKWDVVSFVTGF